GPLPWGCLFPHPPEKKKKQTTLKNILAHHQKQQSLRVFGGHRHKIHRPRYNKQNNHPTQKLPCI
ncbi:hypothetical protein, partial [Enterobacter hormaechei]